jgi:thiamine pyrophosphate-dependent acetolactate synthase large subunit-like protein
VSEKVGRTEPSRLDPTVLAVLIDQLLPPDRVIVADGGRFATHALSHLHARDARHIVQMNGGGSIGLGLGAAVGASFARPEMPVALVTGDSSFMMALTDLDTAVRHRRPIVIFVFNDQAWGAEVAYLESIGLRADVAHLPTPDIAAIARAHGARGITVSTYDELEQVRQFMSVKFDEPMVVDCRIADDTPSSSLDFLFSNSKVS